MEIDKMLTLSLVHIKKETAEYLNDEGNKDLVIYEKSEYGWFIYIDELVSEIRQPDLKQVINFAKENDCAWLCFDRDAGTIDSLPEYNW